MVNEDIEERPVRSDLGKKYSIVFFDGSKRPILHAFMDSRNMAYSFASDCLNATVRQVCELPTANPDAIIYSYQITEQGKSIKLS